MTNQTSITTDNLDMVQLDQIKENPNNPRTYYDEVQLNELAESIKSYGVLQPITVRRLDGYRNFEVVAGNRRYKASLLAGIEAIPAVVMELSDEQALEIALIENIQRVDVHPMEEAVSFKQLIEKQNYTPEDVAHKFGKSVFFVRQRLKLNSLSEASQKLFFEDKFNIANAVKLAQYNEQMQAKILEDAKDWRGESYTFRTNIFDLHSGFLTNTTFDITDSSLVASAGACAVCSFNTSVGSLFPEDEENPRCLKQECFAEKTKVSFDLQLNKAIAQGYRLANDSYSESEIAKELIKEGVPVISTNRLFNVLEKPTELNYEAYKEDWLEFNDEDEDELQSDWQEKLDEYNEELKDYEDELSSGNVVKAFIISGHNKGTYQLIKLQEDADIDNTGVFSEEKQLLNQIENIEAKERKSKEQDFEKIYNKTKELFVKSDLLINKRTDFHLTKKEIIGTALALGNTSYAVRGFIKDNYDIDCYYPNPEDIEKINLTEFGLNEILLFFIQDKLAISTPGKSHQNDARCKIMYDITQEYHSQNVSKIELEQEEITNKRIEKVNANISSLRKKLSDVSTEKV